MVFAQNNHLTETREDRRDGTHGFEYFLGCGHVDPPTGAALTGHGVVAAIVDKGQDQKELTPTTK